MIKHEDIDMTHTVATVKDILETKLGQYATGQIKFTVANQFDQTTLEEALKNVNAESVAKMNDWFSAANNVSAMCIAHYLSAWDAPQIDSAWID